MEILVGVSVSTIGIGG